MCDSLEDYLPHLDDLDASTEEKMEILRVLWVYCEDMVGYAFEVGVSAQVDGNKDPGTEHKKQN